MVRAKEIVVAKGRFSLIKKIKIGKIEIYSGMDNKYKEPVTIKLEKQDTEDSTLTREYQMAKIFEGGPGIINVRYYGKEKEYIMIVVDMMDHSLEQWFNLCGKKFTMKTICMIAMQLLETVQFMHLKKYIHRDIKPENLKTSSASENKTIYLSDYIAAVPFVGPDGKHIPPGKAKVLYGTARYASINLHLGNITSRRDDVETLAYVLVFFAKGELPWQGIQGATLREKFEALTEAKQNTTVEELCQELPQEFYAFLRYVRSLEYTQEPDYDYCKRLFEGIMDFNKLVDDGEFDWVILMSKKIV